MSKSSLMLESISNMAEALNDELRIIEAEKSEYKKKYESQVEVNGKIVENQVKKEKAIRENHASVLRASSMEYTRLKNENDLVKKENEELKIEVEDLSRLNTEYFRRYQRKEKNAKTEEFFKAHSVDLKLPVCPPETIELLLEGLRALSNELPAPLLRLVSPHIEKMADSVTQASPVGVKNDLLDAVRNGYVVVARSGDSSNNNSLAPLAFETPISRWNLADVIKFGKRVEPRNGQAVVCKLVPIRAVVEEEILPFENSEEGSEKK